MWMMAQVRKKKQYLFQVNQSEHDLTYHCGRRFQL